MRIPRELTKMKDKLNEHGEVCIFEIFDKKKHKETLKAWKKT